MNYSDLQDYAEKRKITLQGIAENIGMTWRGMKTSFENQTLPIKKVGIVCEVLGITPNQFFGWNESESEQTARDKQRISKGCTMVTNGNMQHKQVQNGGIGNTQNMDVASTTVLQEQLRIKDEQLKAKDEQISKLMDLLAK